MSNAIPTLGQLRSCPYCDLWTEEDGDCRHCGRAKLDTSKMAHCPWDQQRGTKRGCIACKGSGWVEALENE